MKKRPPSIFGKEIWTQIEFIFRRHDLECLPKGAACDGLDAIEVESTKLGIEIRGGIWFLPGGRGSPNPRFDLNLTLARPRFSSIESVTVTKLGNAAISECSLEDGLLIIVIS